MSDFKRECFFTIASGEMGGGKTYLTKKTIIAYLKAHPHRMCLVFDPNNEDTFHNYKTVYFDVNEVMNRQLDSAKGKNVALTKSEQNLQKIALLGDRSLDERIRRVLPITKDGSEMTPQQCQETMIAVLKNFRRGIVFLEDVNAYMTNFESDRVLGCFKAIRHRSSDVIMHCQSLNPLRPIHYESVSLVRMHKDKVDANKIEGKLAQRFELIKIGQNIIEEMYNQHFDYAEGSAEFYKYKSYHLYVDFVKTQLRGDYSEEQFVEACNRYLLSNKAVTRDKESFIAYKNGREQANQSDKMEARRQWIEEKFNRRMFQNIQTMHDGNSAGSNNRKLLDSSPKKLNP